MGFPNIDLILRDLFLEQFEAAKADPYTVINDLFEDRNDIDRAEIIEFLLKRTFTKDVKDRGERKRVFILPHFPAVDLPFPQIGIYAGESDGTDRAIGDCSSEPVPVYDGDTLIAWDEVKGFWEVASWNVDVIAATKDEVIWLTQLCRYFICQQLPALTAMGILEIDFSMPDLKIDKGTLQPMEFFVRGLRIRAKAANTWKKRYPVGNYQTGINTALA